MTFIPDQSSMYGLNNPMMTADIGVSMFQQMYTPGMLMPGMMYPYGGALNTENFRNSLAEDKFENSQKENNENNNALGNFLGGLGGAVAGIATALFGKKGVKYLTKFIKKP